MPVPANRHAGHPALMRMVDLISAQNPLQSKQIHAFLEGQDQGYWTYAENLCRALGRTFLVTPQDWSEAARSYNRMCMDILREQIRFRKSGVYSIANASQAQEEVYNQPGVMRYYMVGLLLSYLFWPNHYRILRFLQEHLESISIDRYFEIAPGHGLFTVEALHHAPQAEVTLMDISQTSLEITRDLLKTFDLGGARIRSIRADFLQAEVEEQSADVIVMGEVLEHVNNAPEFMRRTRRWLKRGGSLFMTTCANCPAPDHVYQFHDVGEIRALLQDAGFVIRKDIALPAEDFPEEKWRDELVTINYAAILQKAE